MLKDKVVLITGASRGIGRATALLAAEHQAKVIINYNKSKQEADELVEMLTKKGYSAISIKADVSKEDEVKEMFKTIKEKFEKLDVLVNNAGILKRIPLLMTTYDDLEEMIAINIRGVFYCMQRAAKMMSRQGYGKIINVSSIVGNFGEKGLTVYSATKAAVIGLTKSAAKELGDFGITVNAVAPGIIDTEMIEDIRPKMDKIINNIILKRIGTPEDVAKVIIFLSSNLSDYVNGQVIGVDGCQII